ncbi:MAG: hypothetical protein HOH66_17980 [Rhodospirillaceae bacterium]|jgi:hypothetical protein|nr:hypothetical protein [Rhodospirillaceae bacterium]MBT6119756.1 hypothetical protein [Rhodospirillaceae bacterium]
MSENTALDTIQDDDLADEALDRSFGAKLSISPGTAGVTNGPWCNVTPE